MKHKHCDLIVAKAANMDLVVCAKHEDVGWRAISTREFMPVYSGDEYFLCLPQHTEACLHWLNGGEVELSSDVLPKYSSYSLDRGGWNKGSVFMQSGYKIRIKPRKEKRWIVAGNNSLHTMMYFHSKTDAELYHTDDCNAQVIEIEVEITK